MGKEQIVSGSLAFGTAAHALILEPETFYEKYAMLPGDLNLKTNAGKAELEAALAAEPGKLFLTAQDMATLLAMSEGVLAHPTAFKILGAGWDAEVSFYGQRDGREVKVRADLVGGLQDLSGPLTVVDFKTAQDASPEGFRESVETYGYHAQKAWYSQEISRITGRPVGDFIFIVAEKKWPFHAGVYRLGAELTFKGECLIDQAWSRLKECERTGEWPHYGGGEIVIL